MRILLVEDHVDTAKALHHLLKRNGHEVAIAETFAGAIQVADQTQIDLLICDVGLPDGDGLDLLGQLRQKYKLKGICLSGRGSQEDIEQSQSAGFSAHLTKPIDMMKLEAVINELICSDSASGNP